MLDPHSGVDVLLPPDDLLTGDLVAPHYRVMSGGRIQCESKDDIRKRIGRSTDSGDAVVMALWHADGTSWEDAYSPEPDDGPRLDGFGSGGIWDSVYGGDEEETAASRGFAALRNLLGGFGNNGQQFGGQ